MKRVDNRVLWMSTNVSSLVTQVQPRAVCCAVAPVQAMCCGEGMPCEVSVGRTGSKNGLGLALLSLSS